METTLGEFLLILVLLGAAYCLLRPLQRRIEAFLLKILDPRRRKAIDVKDYEVRKDKSSKG